MPFSESACAVEIRRRDILAAAALGLAFGASPFDALGQDKIEKGQATLAEFMARYSAKSRGARLLSRRSFLIMQRIRDRGPRRIMGDGPRNEPFWTHSVARSVAMP